MSDTEDTGDVSAFQKPGIHDEEVSLLMELLFGGWNPDNEVHELYETFDKSDIQAMLETFKDPEDWIDSLMKSEIFKHHVLSEIMQHVDALKFVIKKYYSGKKPTRRPLYDDDEDDNDEEM